MQIKLTNTVDCWVSPDRTSKFGDTRLYIHSLANAYVYFSRPRLPAGSVVTSAILRVYPGATTGNASVTVALHRVTQTFDPNTMTWVAQPTVGAQITSLTRVWAGAPMEFSVTAEMQSVVDGSSWFGWRLSSTSTDATQFINSGQSTLPMELVVEYTSPPPAPTDLYPSANNKVNDPKPTLSWVNGGGPNADQYSAQVQLASDINFTTNLYTSNEMLTTASSLDLDVAAPAFTALTNGQSRYWRVRVKNASGIWSSYSMPAQFTYNTAFTVAITAPAGTTTNDPTPTLTWTYTGVQQSYQILVNLDSVVLYDSGIIHSTTQSIDLPVGVIQFESRPYTISVRVWSTVQPVSTAGTTAYDLATKNITWIPSGATPAVQMLVTAEVDPLPARLIRWQYTSGTPATRFILQRYRNGVIEKHWDMLASTLQEGVTQWYRYVDRIPPGRADVTYVVTTVWASGATSVWAASPQVQVKLNHQMPWVMSVNDPTNRAFCLVNYSINPGLSEISDVIEPISGAPFLAMQALKKYNGTATGQIAGEAVPGNATFTAEKMKANFLWLRENPQVYLVWQDEAIECFMFATDISPIGTADGKTAYAVSFRFIQV